MVLTIGMAAGLTTLSQYRISLRCLVEPRLDISKPSTFENIGTIVAAGGWREVSTSSRQTDRPSIFVACTPIFTTTATSGSTPSRTTHRFSTHPNTRTASRFKGLTVAVLTQPQGWSPAPACHPSGTKFAVPIMPSGASCSAGSMCSQPPGISGTFLRPGPVKTTKSATAPYLLTRTVYHRVPASMIWPTRRASTSPSGRPPALPRPTPTRAISL